MSADSKLDNYLARLDKALHGISVSDRAEIVTEIKSHVLSTRERSPERTTQEVLAALGEPEDVANRFLMERGLKPGKPARGPVAKWLVIGFLGTGALLLIFLTLVMIRFSPIVSVNEKTGRVKILGGLIDVKQDLSAEGEAVEESDENFAIKEGALPLAKEIDTVEVKFTNGKFDILRAEGKDLKWWCRVPNVMNGVAGAFPAPLNNAVTFDANGWAGVTCDISVPSGMKIHVNGNNGRVLFKELDGPVHAELTNGQVMIKPRAGVEYRYELSAVAGRIDSFESSKSPKAIPFEVRLTNGRISKDE